MAACKVTHYVVMQYFFKGMAQPLFPLQMAHKHAIAYPLTTNGRRKKNCPMGSPCLATIQR